MTVVFFPYQSYPTFCYCSYTQGLPSTANPDLDQSAGSSPTHRLSLSRKHMERTKENTNESAPSEA